MTLKTVFRPGASTALPSSSILPEVSSGGRVRSTLHRIGTHSVNVLSNAFGDDIGGRLARRAVIRLAGARVPRSAHILGGTYLSRASNLQVGERCLINRNCYLDLHAPITVGDDVVIGQGTAIITSRHRIGPPQRRAGVVEGLRVLIGAGAWIGANATVLPGVTVGPGSVVAAGAVVTADVPADAVVAGVPARLMRRLAGDVPPAATGTEPGRQ